MNNRNDIKAFLHHTVINLPLRPVAKIAISPYSQETSVGATLPGIPRSSSSKVD